MIGIGISGIARAGKDTLAGCFKKIIEREFDCEVEIVSLAKQLKSDLEEVISSNFDFDVHTENTKDKNLIRPILVAYGESMKEKWGDKIWIQKLTKSLEKRKEKKFYILADVRFDFEAIYLIERYNAEIIHISKDGNKYVNEIEKINDPLVQELSHQKQTWPPYHPDEHENCQAHAEIYWQMIPHYKKEEWKKTINS